MCQITLNQMHASLLYILSNHNHTFKCRVLNALHAWQIGDDTISLYVFEVWGGGNFSKSTWNVFENVLFTYDISSTLKVLSWIWRISITIEVGMVLGHCVWSLWRVWFLHIFNVLVEQLISLFNHPLTLSN